MIPSFNHILKIAIAILLLTVLLFPTKQPGAIINQSTGQTIAEVEIVQISPLIILNHRTSSNSFRIAPSLSEYSGDAPIALVMTGVELSDSGPVQKWSFAFGYWALLIVLPSLVVSQIILSINKKKLKTNN